MLSKPSGSDLAVEYTRLKCLLIAYSFLDLHAVDVREAGLATTVTPWLLCSRQITNWSDAYMDALEEEGCSPAEIAHDTLTGRGVFHVLQPLLRHEVVSATLSADTYKSNPTLEFEEVADLTHKGLVAAIEDLKSADLSPFVRAHLEGLLQERLYCSRLAAAKVSAY